MSYCYPMNPFCSSAEPIDPILVQISEQMYRKMCKAHGMQPEWLHEHIVFRGCIYRIVGLSPQSFYAVIVEDSKGRYLMSAKDVIAAFTASEDTIMVQRWAAYQSTRSNNNLSQSMIEWLTT